MTKDEDGKELARLPPIDKSLRDALREDIKRRKGGIRGHFRSEVESMVREWIERGGSNDTPQEVEDLRQQVQSLQSQLSDLSDEMEDKNKKDSLSKTTKNRLQSIESQVRDEAGDSQVIHKSVIERAIEENAGGSEPTLRRYKGMLKNKRMAFPNPIADSDTWFLDGEVFVKHVESQADKIDATLYDMMQEYGQDWWESHLDDNTDTEKGFQ